MSSDIHPTAVIAEGAQIGEGVSIGPYCTIGPQVKLGDGVRLISHVTIEGRTEIGANCLIHPFVALGGPAQDFKFAGEDVRLIIGPDNVLREHVTMHLGTKARGETRVGRGGYFMVGAHVAHDCVVGDHVVFANNATLGGETTLGDYVIMGGLAAVHQKCRIGRYAFVGGVTAVTGDVIPYGMVDNHGYLAGLNLVGLKRRGFSREVIHDLRAAYRLMFSSEGAFSERLEDAGRIFSDRPEIVEIIDFIRAPSARPLCTPEMS